MFEGTQAWREPGTPDPTENNLGLNKEQLMPKEDNDKAAEGLFSHQGFKKSNDPSNYRQPFVVSGNGIDIYAGSKFKYALVKDGAVEPSKAHKSDSGYDLTIIDIVKDYGKTKLYGTGVKIQPPKGVYFDMVARSSISKLGYIVTNSIGIIDNQYRGELMVALTKIDDSKPDLKLPLRIAQLVPRWVLDLEPIQILEENLEHEERGEAGWGSTGT